MPYHPERPERRTISLCPGDTIMINRDDYNLGEVRLMGAVNVRFEDNEAVMISKDLSYARGKKLQVVQRVPERDAVKLAIYKPQELDMKEIRGYAENSLKMYGVDSRLQLIRFGFIRVDEVSEEEYRAFLIHD
ncbi:MAG: hypothetical protein ACUVRY_07680 [Thermoanaerobaculaceae bacterium]